MRRRTLRSLTSCGLALLLCTTFAQTQKLQTPAERVNYQQGGTLYQPLMDFVYELESQTDLMHVQKLTETLMGRDIVLCILSNPAIFQPEDMHRSRKPVVLIVNNVHGGEVAGKDASLEIMRDLIQGDLRPLLDHVIVLNVPTINPDGAEVRRRTNEQGFDLNRDYLKLESQEVGALVTRVINRWHPDIWIDTHHGGSAPYTLTYQTNMNPAGDAELVRFGNQEILARVRQALRAEDYDGFWYTGPGRVDGVDGWVPTSVEPRKQHVYGALVNSVGFLFETPSNTHRVVDNGKRIVPNPPEEVYRHQVRGQYIGQREMIRFAAQRAADLRKVITEAHNRAVARGDNDADNDQVVLEYQQVSSGNEDFWIRKGRPGAGRGGGRGAAGGGRGAGGDQAAVPLGADVEYELVNRPVFTTFEPTRTATRPWGYLIPPGLAKLVPILLDQQISVKRLTRPVSLDVEVYYATEVRADQYFQGHYLKTVKAEKRTEKVDLPAGTLFVPSGQPRSNLISYLLEPETDDNLVTWGYLNDVLKVTPLSDPQQLGEDRARIDSLPPEERQKARQALDRRQRSQRIPIYRLMKKTNLAGVLVQSADAPVRHQYYRY